MKNIISIFVLAFVLAAAAFAQSPDRRWTARAAAGAVALGLPAGGGALVQGAGPAISTGFTYRPFGAWRLGASVGAAAFVGKDGLELPLPLANLTVGYRSESGVAVDLGVGILPSVGVSLPAGLRVELGALPLYMQSGGSTTAYLLVGWERAF
jgi:hypothetical protein